MDVDRAHQGANLKLLAYVSSAVPLLNDEELQDLVIQARKANEQVGITGILYYVEGSVFQAIEGDPEAVENLFEKIQRDARHRGLICLLRTNVSKRSFGDWSMGLIRESRRSLGQLDSVARLLNPTSQFTTHEQLHLRVLLEQFINMNRYAAA